MTQAITGGQYSKPKTVLGFLGVVLLIVTSFSLGVIIALVGTDYEWLIVPILLFDGLGLVALVVAVLVLAAKDPTPLVLGEMTGHDFTAHKQLVMGDSASGERLQTPVAPPDAPAEVEKQDAARELPTGESAL